MVLVFLVRNLLLSIFFFFKRWYWNGYFLMYGKVLGIVRRLERALAVRANLYFLFQPLYQEYNVFGYAVGFVVRFARITAGLVLYGVVVLAGITLYVVWALIPPVLILKSLGF